MVLFSSSEPYTPIMRKPRRDKPLTPEQARYILENPNQTGYTYAKSASYSPNNPSEYVNPNLSRSSLLSTSTSSSISNTFGAEHSSSFYKSEKWKCIWSLLFATLCSLLLFWIGYPQQHFLASTETCPRPDAAADILYSPQQLQCPLNEEEPPLSTDEKSPSSLEERYAAMYTRLKNEMDKYLETVRSMIAASDEANDDRIVAAVDKQRLELLASDLFAKERQKIREEREQLVKIMEEQSNIARPPLDVSEEEIAKLVQESINKLDLSSLIGEIVRTHLEEHVSEAEQHSMEIIENKIVATVSEALRRYNTDKTGEADFALETAGGSVLTTRGTKEYHPLHRRETLFWVPLWFNSFASRVLIQRQSQNVNAGECWGIEGSKGNVVIELAHRINVTAITYEHLPRELSLSGDIDSAPKMFKIYSLQHESDEDKFLIGRYTFDADGDSLQRFAAERYDPRGTSIIEYELFTNYGAPFTCLYRLRVHGNPL